MLNKIYVSKNIYVFKNNEIIRDLIIDETKCNVYDSCPFKNKLCLCKGKIFTLSKLQSFYSCLCLIDEKLDFTKCLVCDVNLPCRYLALRNCNDKNVLAIAMTVNDKKIVDIAKQKYDLIFC